MFSDFPTVTIIWVVWAIVYQQVENNLVQPQIQKRAVDINPFLVIVSVLFGSALLGVLGALVAVPVAATIQIVLREWADWQGSRRGTNRRRPTAGSAARRARSTTSAGPRPEPASRLAAATAQQRDGGGDAAAEHEARRQRPSTSAASRFSASWRRQSASSVTFERRSLTEKASSWRVSSIELRICSGVRLAGTPDIG